MTPYDPNNPQNPPNPEQPGYGQQGSGYGQPGYGQPGSGQPPMYPPNQPPAYPPNQPGYGQPGYPPPQLGYPGGQPPMPPRRSRAGMIAGIVAAVIVVCLIACAGGLYVIGQRAQGAASSFVTTLTPTTGGQATCDLTTHVCDHAPIMTINTAKTYIATIETAKGNIVIQLDAKNTPITVNNFVFLAQQHFYDNTYFWRVEAPGLTSPLGGASQLQLIQGGSVTNNGQDPTTVPGYTIKDEKVTGSYTAGDVAMANTGKPDTGSTQFFICTGDNSKLLSKSYTIFGHVISGMDVATKISPQDVIKTVTIQVK